MGASGANHAPGFVPDPGPTAGTAKFLREDATFAVALQSLPVATTSTLGGVKPDGTTITVDGTGKISSSYQPSVLPVPPALAAFTFLNQGTATASNNGNSIALTIVDTGATLQWRLLKQTAPTTPYSIAAFFKGIMFDTSSQTIGLYFTDGTKLLGLETLAQSTGLALRVERITNVTTDGSTQKSVLLTIASGGLLFPNAVNGGMYARLRNDGTTLFIDISADGSNWTNFYSEAVGAFLTPNAYGFGGVSVTGSIQPDCIISLQGWLATNSAAL